MSAATGHVDQGVGLVAQAGSELAKVVSEISHIDESIAAIAASATQQAGSLAQVDDAVRSTDRITQQNAAMVEETTAAVTALVEDIEQLDMLIGQFKTEIPLSSPASTPGRTRRPLRTQAASQKLLILPRNSGNRKRVVRWQLSTPSGPDEFACAVSAVERRRMISV